MTDYTQLKETLALTNTAQLFIGDAAYPPVTAQATVDPPEVATKGQLYTQSTHPIVQYTITINPKALDLIPEGAEQAFYADRRDRPGAALRAGYADSQRLRMGWWRGVCRKHHAHPRP